VIAAAPSEVGGWKLTIAEPFPATADTDRGAPGTLRGTTAFEGLDGGLVPIAFAAVTVKVYVVPSLSPEITQLVDVLVVQVCPPGVAVAV
jgi:hypothetical protein